MTRGFEIDVAALTAPCPRCKAGSVRQTGDRTAWCATCEASADDYDREARNLLEDRGDRSWADVERDVAAALRRSWRSPPGGVR